MEGHELDGVLSLSENMLEAARYEDWDELSVLHKQRETLLKRTFTRPGLVTESETARRVLQRVWELNRQLSILVETERGKCRDQIDRLRLGRRGTAAYMGA